MAATACRQESQQRALECLARFGQRLRHIPPARLRIVGTNTLRQARNSAEFVARAEQLSATGRDRQRPGGSAPDLPRRGAQRRRCRRAAAGDRYWRRQHRADHRREVRPLHLASLRMGCVSFSRACFADGRITASRLREAELLVQLNLEPVREEYLAHGWEVATGASGSIKAIQDVLVSEGWSREGITCEACAGCARRCSSRRHGGIASRWQLDPARARVFVGGFVVLHGLCEALAIEQLEVSEGALREGLIYDLLGRIRHEDVRDRTIADVIRRFNLDEGAGGRGSARLCARSAAAGQRQMGLGRKEGGDVLERAARLHEVGLLLTHDQHHKHGAYVLQHADLPGYSRDDQLLLSVLVGATAARFRARPSISCRRTGRAWRPAVRPPAPGGGAAP
jgi:exopolyphosphatase/guanosine-5'-triphosphate,3'-diphosphate pyrophosphatase